MIWLQVQLHLLLWDGANLSDKGNYVDILYAQASFRPYLCCKLPKGSTCLCVYVFSTNRLSSWSAGERNSMRPLVLFVYMPLGNTYSVSPLAQCGTQSLTSIRRQQFLTHTHARLGCSCWTSGIQGTVESEGSDGCISSKTLGNECFLWINFACPCSTVSVPVCT